MAITDLLTSAERRGRSSGTGTRSGPSHAARTRRVAALLVGLALGASTLAALPPPAVAAGPVAPGPPPRGLLGATLAPPLPVTVVGEPDVVSATQALRFERVGGAVERVAGADRYATAVAISRHEHPGHASRVVIASGAAYPDAIVAAPLAARVGGPLLLVPSSGLPAVVADELVRLAPTQVTVVGGPAVVPDATVARIRAMTGASVGRLWGADRYATAAAVARRFPGGVEGLVVATGLDFPDALTAAPVAHALGGPVLLVAGSTLSPAIATQLVRLAPRRVIIAGGAGVVSPALAQRIGQLTGRSPERAGGADRYATAAALATMLRGLVTVRSVVVATGLAFPDALAAGAAAARWPAPVLLTSTTSARGAATAAEIGRLRGVGSWVRLVLDLEAQVRAMADPSHAAYAAAYEAEILAHLYGWDDPGVRERLDAVRAARKPGGGYGLDVAWDAFGDGTVNPVGTRYLVTITDHVGRAMLDAWLAGRASRSEVLALVDMVLAWPRVADDADCLAYSDSGFDGRWCVYNVSSGAAWFLRRSWDLGIRRTGQLALAQRLVDHDALAYDGTGWWPYRDGTTGRQDWNHNAWTVEAHLLFEGSAGADALARVMAGGMWHPDAATRHWDDPMGYLRLLPFDCLRRSGAVAAARDVAARQGIASDTAQLALWAARTAVACGP